MSFLALIRIVPVWCYWVLSLVALCCACELHGRHAEAKKWEAKIAASSIAARETEAELSRLQSKSTYAYLNSVLAQKEKANALPTIVFPVDCAVPASAIRLLNDATRMPSDTGATGPIDGTTEIVDSTCAKQLNICKRNYAEACIPNAQQLEEIQRQWDIVRDKYNALR